MSPAWLMYLGLFFVWVVVAAPEGLAGWSATPCAAYGWRVAAPLSGVDARGRHRERTRLRGAVRRQRRRRWRILRGIALDGRTLRCRGSSGAWACAVAGRCCLHATRAERAMTAALELHGIDKRFGATRDSARRRSVGRARRTPRADRSERRGQVDALRSDRGPHASRTTGRIVLNGIDITGLPPHRDRASRTRAQLPDDERVRAALACSTTCAARRCGARDRARWSHRCAAFAHDRRARRHDARRDRP